MGKNSLDILETGVSLAIADHRLTIRPVILRELPAVGRVMRAWQLLIATGGEGLDIEAYGDFCRLMASACGKDDEFIQSLEPKDFERLAAIVLAINERLWKPHNVGGKDVEWAEVAQRLVSHGHSLDDVRDMTLDQAEACIIASAKIDRERMAELIQAAAFSGADAKSVKSAVKRLTNG